MEIIAQAVIGLSGFLHPGYVHAASRPSLPSRNFVIDFSDGIFSLGEKLVTVYSITGFIILGIFVSFLISVIKNRY